MKMPEHFAFIADAQIELSSEFSDFCIYEIDTPAGHLCGSNFADQPVRHGYLNPVGGPPMPTLRDMLHSLKLHQHLNDYDTAQIFGHFTTSRGSISYNARDLLENYFAHIETFELLDNIGAE